MMTAGIGHPIALIPGIQGRWEWLKPTVGALSGYHRVITASLTELRPKRRTGGDFLDWIPAIDTMLDRAGERRVSLIGVSFGGLIAACYAARRPDRVAALVLVSPPPPTWTLRRGDAFCARFPRLSLPYFGVRGVSRLGKEIYRARDSWKQRARLGREYAGRAIKAPISPVCASRWVQEWQSFDISDDCRKILAPTLIITGDADLDRIVPVERSLQYLHLIPGATHAVLEGTGHIGLITRPHRFADMAGRFIDRARAARPVSSTGGHTINHAS
jgi:pimeloyl-ACP methyl ester carboxylesterase